MCTASHFDVAREGRRKRSVNPTTVTPAYKSWGSSRENCFLLLQNSPPFPRSLTKGPHLSLSLSLSHTHTHTHTHNMCSWVHKSFHNLGLSDSCLFAHLFLGVCGCGCHSNTQGQGPLSKLAHFNSCPSSCLLLGLVGVVPKRLAFLKAGAAGAAAWEQLPVPHPSFLSHYNSISNFLSSTIS